MNFCLYLEHSAENLQFYLWFQDYKERFHQASQSEKDLSPKWTFQEQEDTIERVKAEARQLAAKRVSSQSTRGIFKGIDFSVSSRKTDNPFVTPPSTGDSNALTQAQRDAATPWATHEARVTSSGVGSVQTTKTGVESFATGISAATIASQTFANAGLNEPCTYRFVQSEYMAATANKNIVTVQPYREEIDRIIATYFADNAPRELNLDGPRRKTVLIALQKTTHPTALGPINCVVEETLRGQLHPNFIRWSIGNGNKPRQIFALWLGLFLITMGIASSIALTLSSYHRGYRAFGAILIILGTATFNAAKNGMCVVLHGFHHQHLRPWELFLGDDQELLEDPFTAFGGKNSYEDRPWVVKYQKRNIIRKIFDREIWIMEPALRQLQDRIFLQSIFIGFLIAGVLMAIFLSVPAGNRF